MVLYCYLQILSSLSCNRLSNHQTHKLWTLPIWIFSLEKMIQLPILIFFNVSLVGKKKSKIKPESWSECFGTEERLPPKCRCCGRVVNILSKQNKFFDFYIFLQNFSARIFLMYFLFSYSLLSSLFIAGQLLKPTECTFPWKEVQILFI